MELRFSSYRNPLGLGVGECIRWTHSVEFVYNDHNIKYMNRVPNNYPTFSAIVIGVVRKAEGTYHRGCRSLDPESYEPDSFKTSKTHWVYECRRFIDSKPFLVHPDDVLIP